MQEVTIVIPAYNQAQYLPEAIESALAQTVPCEVTVVVDASPDNSLEIALGYPVKVIEHLENKGLAAARNTGISAADTKWVLTLDSDDKIAPDFIEKTIGVSDIVGTWQQEFGDSSNLHRFNPEPTHEMFYQNNQINCCSLYKKEIWEKIGGYDESMRIGYEDWDFWLRATKAGYKVKVVPEPLFFYRKHGQSMVSNAIRYHNELVDYMRSKL